MHRSGTSLTAQWLHKCGLNIGNDLMQAHFTNKDGHFEDMEFHDLHEEIFRAHDIPYGGFKNIDNFKPTKEEIEKLKKLIDKKNKKNEQWGWKEPRTCLFIEEYLQIIPNAKIVLIIRNYLEVINSLVNRRIKIKHENIKKTGRLSIFRLIIYKLKNEENDRKVLCEKFTKATIVYYKRLKKVKEKNHDKIIIIEFDKIIKNDNKIIQKLKEWQFDIQNIPISTIFKNNYITSKPEKKMINEQYLKVLTKLEKYLLNIHK